FCKKCIQQLATASTAYCPSSTTNDDTVAEVSSVPCPIDRISFHPSSLTSTIVSIANIVDELLVRCPYRKYSPVPEAPTDAHNEDVISTTTGCPWVGQRSKLIWHMETECMHCPIPCGAEGCSVSQTRQEIEAHRLSCLHLAKVA